MGNAFFELRSKRESEGTGGASSKLWLWRDRFSADLACLKNGKFEMEGFLRDWPYSDEGYGEFGTSPGGLGRVTICEDCRDRWP
jgi:hypothetical protein